MAVADALALGSALGRVADLGIEGMRAAAARSVQVTLASGVSVSQESLTLVRTLEPGESWGAIQDEMRYLQWSTGREHYLISSRDASASLFSGGRYSTTFEFTTEMRRILAHTHPVVSGPSPEDFATLRALGQRSSWLLEPGMPLQRFRTHP
jgi:hypothetical protein